MSTFTNQALKDKILRELSYTNRDYDNIMNELITVLNDVDINENRDWGNISSSDPFFILLHLMAAHKDILNYQIDYSVLESYMTTARERSSMTRIANSFGYKIPGYRAAYAEFEVEGADNTSYTFTPFETVYYDRTSGAGIPWVYIEKQEKEYQKGNIVPLYQGQPVKTEFFRGNIDSISNTKIAANDQISIGTNGYLKGASRITANNGEIEYIEVENILTHKEEHNNVYELVEDTLNTVSIKFHIEAALPEDSGAIMNFNYIVTRGADVLTNNNMEGLGVEVPNLKATPSFIRGSNQASSQEVKQGFREYNNSIETLVTLKDYRNYILKQKEVPDIAKVLVADGDRNSGTLSNSEIGIGLITEGAQEVPLIKPGEIWVYALKTGNKPLDTDTDEQGKLEAHLTELKVTGTKVMVKPDIEKVEITVKIKGASTNTKTQEKITEVIKTLINNLPIGGYITAGDIYYEIMNNRDIAQTSRNLEVKLYEDTDPTAKQQIQLKYNEYGTFKEVEYTA